MTFGGLETSSNRRRSTRSAGDFQFRPTVKGQRLKLSKKASAKARSSSSQEANYVIIMSMSQVNEASRKSGKQRKVKNKDADDETGMMRF